MAAADFVPNPIDLHVGNMIRFRRKSLKISQEQLADSLKLTFQQVQKYERGANRVSASKLYAIARALKTTPAFFFPALDAEDSDFNASSELIGFLGEAGGIEIAQLFTRLRPAHRGTVIRVAKTIVECTDAMPQATAA